MFVHCAFLYPEKKKIPATSQTIYSRTGCTHRYKKCVQNAFSSGGINSFFHARTSLFLKWIPSHQLQWLNTHAHSGLMSTASLETAWWEQRGGIFMPLSKGLESLEMRRVLLSSHNGNNYQTEEACFWNKVCFIIQLMLGCSHQIPSVITAERLSVPLGPMPVQYLMLLPGACLLADTETDLDASQMKCALRRESRF